MNFLKKSVKFLGLAGFILLVMIVLVNRGFFSGIQRSLQNKFYDYDAASSEIIVVAIDEKSLQESELGPLTQWPRANYANAIEILNQNDVATIGVDITFPDGSVYGIEDDETLGAILQRYDNVVLASRYFFDGGKKRFEWPNQGIIKGNPTLGSINVQLDEDGFVRSIPVFSESEKGVIEAFSLALSRVYLKAEVVDYRVSEDEFRFSQDISIPVMSRMDLDSGERTELMYLNYFAKPNEFIHLSFTDLLKGNFIDKKGNPVDFRDKIVIIGPTAIDLQDDYLSPVSEGVRMPGVEIHANGVQTIVTQQFLKDQSALFFWLTLLGIVLINTTLFSFLKVRYALGLIAIEMAATIIGGIVAYEYLLLVNVVYPLLAILLSFVGTYLLRFILEQKERKFIEGALGRYVNKTVVKQIQQHPEMLKLGGVKRELSVFFSDIAGFTSISEQMGPEELVSFLNEYLGEMTDIIMKSGGTLDKYEGDAIMAFWNAPLGEPEHALKACLAALKNQERLAELRQKWAKRGLPEMHVRIGINTGEAVVGNMGSANRFNYTAMGDNVNLASRLESINKQYGTYLMISGATYDKVKDEVVCRELDEIRVKGKKESVRVYELLGIKGELTPEMEEKKATYERALTMYRNRDFMPAKIEFEKLKNDPAAEIFAKRCADFMKNPPAADWDGVWTFEVK